MPCNTFNVIQFVNNKTSHLHPPPADDTGVIHGIAHRVCQTKTLHIQVHVVTDAHSWCSEVFLRLHFPPQLEEIMGVAKQCARHINNKHTA